MTKTIFEKIELNKDCEELFEYAHSKTYKEKRENSSKRISSFPNIRNKRPNLRILNTTIST